jgi:hypothetical protein
MRRESHVRFWEGGGVRLPSATRLVNVIAHGQSSERRCAFGCCAIAARSWRTSAVCVYRSDDAAQRQDGREPLVTG